MTDTSKTQRGFGFFFAITLAFMALGSGIPGIIIADPDKGVNCTQFGNTFLPVPSATRTQLSTYVWESGIGYTVFAVLMMAGIVCAASKFTLGLLIAVVLTQIYTVADVIAGIIILANISICEYLTPLWKMAMAQVIIMAVSIIPFFMGVYASLENGFY